MRKAKVNDIVRSFVFGVRRQDSWPFPILGRQWENAMQPIENQILVPFASFAYAHTANYLIANRNLILLASFLRDLSPAEQAYAASLMYKFYIKAPNVSA